MAASDQTPDRAKVISAAYAAASWARARRATWTDAPLPEPPAADLRAAGIPAPAPEPVRPVVTPRAEPVSHDELVVPLAVPAAARPRDEERSTIVAPPIFTAPEPDRSSARVFIVGGVVLAFLAGGYFVSRRFTGRPPAPAAAPSQAGTPAQASPAVPVAPRRVGTLQVNSTPDGARVAVDGAARGVTPLSIANLAVGKHTVEIQSAEGAVRRTVTIAAGETATIEENIYAGWVKIDAPFELTVSDGERPLSIDERGQVFLAPGTHELRMTNRELVFETTRHVEVKPGQMTTVYVTPVKSAVTVTAGATSEVWIDGTRAGETPLFGYAVEIGTHDVTVRRNGNERTFTVTVTTQPLTINVDAQR